MYRYGSSRASSVDGSAGRILQAERFREGARGVCFRKGKRIAPGCPLAKSWADDNVIYRRLWNSGA